MDNSKKVNTMYESKPWLIKYLYSAADPNTEEGAKWHRTYARNLFAAVGVIVVLSIVLSKVLH